MNEEVIEESLKEKKYERIEGWLVFVGIGIILAPLLILVDLWLNFSMEIRLWWSNKQLFVPVPLTFSLAPLSLFRLLVDIGLFVFSLIVAVYFFRRRRIAPILFIIFLTIYLVFTATQYFVVDKLVNTNPPESVQDVACYPPNLSIYYHYNPPIPLSEKEGVLCSFMLVDASGAMTASDGIVTLTITGETYSPIGLFNPFEKLYSTTIEVKKRDFIKVKTEKGSSQIQGQVIIPYSSFFEKPVAARKSIQGENFWAGEAEIVFQRSDGKFLEQKGPVLGKILE